MNSIYEEVKTIESPLKILELALQEAAAGGKNKKQADFNEAYPLIEQHLAKKVPFKVVLEQFNAAYGHKVHPPRFRKMLMDERNRRSMTGEVMVCSACGQQLISTQTEQKSNGTEDVDHD